MPVSDITPVPDPPVAPAVTPPIPPELWALWQDSPEHEAGGYWVPSLDNTPHGETILVAFSEREAFVAAVHQDESYGLDCRPVRIK